MFYWAQETQKKIQSIYANASEETKRAMMKSFQESNGTVLSTNWNEGTWEQKKK